MNAVERGRPAVLADRDGTLCREVGYLWRWKDFRWIEGVPDALARLSEAGFALVVVSNQSGVARGIYEEDDVKALHERAQADLIARTGVGLDAWYHCPHLPDGGCSCRKPSPGMLLKAASELGLDLSSSFMVGDKTLDVLAGRNAGTREAILVRTGHGREAERELPPGAAVADDFPAAAALILAELKRGATKRV